MREILFRGKTIKNGDWAEGDLVINRPSRTYRIFVDFANVRHGNFTDTGLHECSGELYVVYEETLGQFTGLTDVTNKDIWEGDIIKNVDTEELQVVFWNNEKAAWYCRYMGDANSIVSLHDSIGNLNEKIGNIHDNPELLTISSY